MDSIDTIYENLDKMQEMKRYKHPTPGYFPTPAEVNTYLNNGEFEYMLEYMLWLDSCLTPEQRSEHREALSILRDFVAKLEEKEEQ